MKEKILHYDNLGEIAFVRSAKAKRISISLRPFKGIRVLFPENVSMEQAQQFVENRRTWISKHLPHVKQMENNQHVYLPEKDFSTKFHTLQLHAQNTGTIKISVRNKIIQVFYPENVEVTHPKIQQAIRTALIEAWRIEGRFFLVQRTQELAQKFDLKVNKITIKNITSRWGSCSHRNNINLSLHLMRLPYHLIDYVILHELSHTIHKNHGKDFWQFLDKISGNAKGLDKEMNKYRTSVF